MNTRIISAVTVGNFDGVHRGHQAVLAQLCERAASLRAAPVVVTFEPLPREYFLGDEAPRRIQPLRDRVAALRAYGIARVVCLRFDAALAATEPRAFVADTLVRRLGARAVVIGDDFRFGYQRGGDAGLLRELGREFGFEVEAASGVSFGGRVSSTRIRALLGAGRLAEAAALIGRPYTVSGRVRRGDALGRRLGFPTANLVPRRPLALIDGVYAARVDGRPAAVYVGRGRVEVHLIGFSGELYGRMLTVEFEEFLRGDEQFDDIDALRRRIADDVEQIAARGAAK